MTNLSKSKLLYYLNCPKRLWLEVHGPKVDESDSTRAKFEIGHSVGDAAQKIYDPHGKGCVFIPKDEGYFQTCDQTPAALTKGHPVFEAGFQVDGAWCFVDAMLPTRRGGKRVWRMVEVKSSGEMKAYHRDDAAIQSFIVRRAGVDLAAIALAHIDTKWVYPGGDNYIGLLKETDVTDEAFGRSEEVQRWIAGAKKIVTRRKAPDAHTGKQCNEPWECRFYELCAENEPRTEYPVAWLRGPKTNALNEFLAQPNIVDLKQVPDELLNEKHLRVKQCAISGKAVFNRKGTQAALAKYSAGPHYFLDFETINFPVPIWKGTSPYQQIPFQFSLHRLAKDGSESHKEFLDLSGTDPSKAIAEALLIHCGRSGPIFAYNAKFEKGCINKLAKRFSPLRDGLTSLTERIVDLLPIAERHYCHPAMEGSWSLKNLLPAIKPKLSYETLEGVRDGTGAMDAYGEAVHRDTTMARKREIEGQLLKYCKLDTQALVEIWRKFC